MTPAHLARWARRFRRGRLDGPPGTLAWDEGAPPGAEAFGPWVAARGPVSAELHCDDLAVTLLPGVVLAVDRRATLRLAVPLSEAGTLAGTATASLAGARWVVSCAGVAVPAFDTVALTPDGALDLRDREAGPVRRRGLRAGSRLVTRALRASSRWARVVVFLPARGQFPVSDVS